MIYIVHTLWTKIISVELTRIHKTNMPLHEIILYINCNLSMTQRWHSESLSKYQKNETNFLIMELEHMNEIH